MTYILYEDRSSGQLAPPQNLLRFDGGPPDVFCAKELCDPMSKRYTVCQTSQFQHFGVRETL